MFQTGFVDDLSDSEARTIYGMCTDVHAFEPHRTKTDVFHDRILLLPFSLETVVRDRPVPLSSL